MNRLFGIGQPKYGYNTYDREIHFDQGSTYLKFRPGEELMLEMVRSALLCSCTFGSANLMSPTAQILSALWMVFIRQRIVLIPRMQQGTALTSSLIMWNDRTGHRGCCTA